jgi:hypothetical protein
VSTPLKKQRNKHSSRSADLRLRQPFSSWANRLASATPANTISNKTHDFIKNWLKQVGEMALV